MLDELPAGLILVDGDSLIVRTNCCADTMLAEEHVVRRRGMRLSAVDPSADQLLQGGIRSIVSDQADFNRSGTVVSMVSREALPWVANVLPLTNGLRRKAGMQYDAVAAIFVRKAVITPPHSFEVISSLYKLTPMEMCVLMAIVDVGGVPERRP